MSIQDKISQGWIHAIIVVEVLGKPPEHVSQVLEKAIEKLAQENDLEIVEKKFYEPHPVENIFSTFAEIEILFADIKKLIDIIFDYMPSSIEILEPQELKFKAVDATNFLNDLAARLHQYDALAKQLKVEKYIVEKKLEETNKAEESKSRD